MTDIEHVRNEEETEIEELSDTRDGYVSNYIVDRKAISKSRRSMLFLCHFFNSKPAVMYCSADSASLCLFCDQQVHSANALSLKHVRSQICDGCKAKPTSFLCSDDNLMLCHYCDRNSRNAIDYCGSITHQHSPVEGFPGCPSVIQLASLFGFDLKPKDLIDLIPGFSSYKRELTNIEDFMPLEENSCVSSTLLSSIMLDHEVYRQLIRMGKRDLVRVSGDGDEQRNTTSDEEFEEFEAIRTMYVGSRITTSDDG